MNAYSLFFKDILWKGSIRTNRIAFCMTLNKLLGISVWTTNKWNNSRKWQAFTSIIWNRSDLEHLALVRIWCSMFQWLKNWKFFLKKVALFTFFCWWISNIVVISAPSEKKLLPNILIFYYPSALSFTFYVDLVFFFLIRQFSSNYMYSIMISL